MTQRPGFLKPPISPWACCAPEANLNSLFALSEGMFSCLSLISQWPPSYAVRIHDARPIDVVTFLPVVSFLEASSAQRSEMMMESKISMAWCSTESQGFRLSSGFALTLFGRRPLAGLFTLGQLLVFQFDPLVHRRVGFRPICWTHRCFSFFYSCILSRSLPVKIEVFGTVLLRMSPAHQTRVPSSRLDVKAKRPFKTELRRTNLRIVIKSIVR